MPRPLGPRSSRKGGTPLKRASITVLLLTLVGVQGAASATSSGGNTLALSHLRLPSNAITATTYGDSVDVRAPALRPEEALLDAVDPADVRSHGDGVRAFIEATAGVRLPDLRPEHSTDPADPSVLIRSQDDDSDPPPPPGEWEFEDTGTQSYPAPGGDLDGDGLDDVLVLEITLPDETIMLRALRGTDGSELWNLTLDAADAVPFPAGDLTGDGVGDLLLWEFRVLDERFTEDCPEGSASCRYEYDATYEWTVGLRNGKSGNVRWTKRYPGEDHYRYESERQGTPPVIRTTHAEERYDSSNYVVVPLPSGDHDGDGLPDLVLESFDVAVKYEDDWTSAADRVGHGTGTSSIHSATRAAVVRGVDGQMVLNRESEEGPGFTYLEPVDDLVGGPAPDLVWEEFIIPDDGYACVDVDGFGLCPDESEEVFALDIEVVDGGTLQTAWSVSTANILDGFSIAIPEDVSGDGIDDILLFVYVDEDLPFVTRLLSGADGKRLWERRQSDDEQWIWDMPLGLGEMSGDGTPDLLFGNFRNPLLGETSARFTRVNGPTGATLFETSHLFKSLSDEHDFSAEYKYIAGMSDVDGDAVDEPFMGSVAEGWDWDPLTGEESPGEVVSSSLVESGRSGTVLHEKTSAELFSLEPAPDLDGDGRPEAFEWHFPLNADDLYGVVVQTLAPTAALWSRSLTSDEFWNLWAGGDHDGAAGDELLYARNDYAPNDEDEDDDDPYPGGKWTSVVASLEGSTGAERWKLER